MIVSTGATGPQGEPGNGTIIPFSSGAQISITSLEDGQIGAPALLGFGTFGLGTEPLNTTINIDGSVNSNINYSFIVPQDSVLTNFSALFSITTGEDIEEGDYTVHAKIYKSQTPSSNIFEEILSTDIELAPSFTDNDFSFGDTAIGSVTINENIVAGTRLLIVFYLVPPASSQASTINGYASAGLAITY